MLFEANDSERNLLLGTLLAFLEARTHFWHQRCSASSECELRSSLRGAPLGRADVTRGERRGPPFCSMVASHILSSKDVDVNESEHQVDRDQCKAK